MEQLSCSSGQVAGGRGGVGHLCAVADRVAVELPTRSQRSSSLGRPVSAKFGSKVGKSRTLTDRIPKS